MGLSSWCMCEDAQTRKLVYGEILAEQSDPGGLPGLLSLPIPLVVDAFGLGVMVLPQVPKHVTAEKAYWGSRLSDFTSGFSSIFS